jgi:hypothetical protein
MDSNILKFNIHQVKKVRGFTYMSLTAKVSELKGRSEEEEEEEEEVGGKMNFSMNAP